MTLAEKAVEKLRVAILKGEFSTGPSITERQVSEYLGISRTPVRAALQTLSNEGLLDYEAQRGYRVRSVNHETISDAYMVRAALEALASQIVAETGLPAETSATLEACVAEGRDLLGSGAERFQHEEWRNMNNRFHQAIVDAAGNETLGNSLAHVALMPMMSFKVIATIGASPNMALLEGSQRDHEQILLSLQAGQSMRVSNRMREHILFAGDLISKVIRRQYGESTSTGAASDDRDRGTTKNENVKVELRCSVPASGESDSG
ncbi:GntR family transcriptional regulator [Salipiger aestuarii]|uniref:GntR family transcriptional regulator n=2 Tax=Salipiger aestuarii TaxID=568098 RepID=A0A327XH53_9RHOB|nr:GntR family transcriptional regulator [Salipiger aestuarii]RAK07804.1 GntR family transcriptional regulator [Salipiger aestuarii]